MVTYRTYYHELYSVEFPDEERRYCIDKVEEVLLYCFYHIAKAVIYDLFIFRPPYRWGEFKMKEVNQNHVKIINRIKKRNGVKKRVRSYHSFNKTFSLKWSRLSKRLANFKNRMFFKFNLYQSLCPMSDDRFKDVGNQGVMELVKSRSKDPEQKNYSAY